jgi:hypothetical protein
MTSINSAELAAIEDTPRRLVDAEVSSGVVRAAFGNLNLATGNLNVSDLWRLARIRSNARIIEIALTGSGLGGVEISLGLYTPARVAKAPAVYGSLIPMGGTGGYAVRVVNDVQAKVHQDAGDTNDPGGHYDVVGTVTASSGPLAGSISWVILFVQPS